MIAAPNVIVLVEALALLNNSLGQAVLVLSEDARLHVLLGDLLAQGFLKALRRDVEDEFVLALRIVDPLFDVGHELVQLVLMRA